MLTSTLRAASTATALAVHAIHHDADGPARALPARVNARESSELARRIAESMDLLQQKVQIHRRVMRAGDTVYQAGQQFACLYIVHSGFFKLLNLAPDGRQQLVALQFKGDWLGFDGIAHGAHSCDAVAMDTGEVWGIRYDALLRACAQEPALLTMVHSAMSREMLRDRESMMSLCTLTADARVAEFLRHWVESLSQRGLRTDQITLRLTRAEIGNYLGMTLESVSRALSRLARAKVIEFVEKGRRHISIPDAQALGSFVQSSLTPHTATVQ